MKQTIALVLGSGGARGIAHIGVIRELQKQGYEISSISGASMGALIGGVYASGKLDEFESWLCSLSKRDIFNLVDFTLSKQGIIKADRFLKEIQKFIPDQKIEDLPIKYTAVATDLKNKKEVVITEGSLFEAIRSSISIPLIITPVQKIDTFFVDGGVLNPVPVNRVFRQENDILVAVNVNSLISYQKSTNNNTDSGHFEQFTRDVLIGFPKKIVRLLPGYKKENIWYYDLIVETIGLMLSQISRLTLEMNPPDFLIEISKQSCGVFDFHKAAELIELGKISTMENFKK